MLFLRSVFNSGARFKHVLSDTKQLSTGATLFATSKSENRGRLPKGYNAINAYSLFLKNQYKPGQTIGEVGKRTAELWKNLASTDKQKYESEAKKETDRRREEFSKLSLPHQLDLKEKDEKRLIKRYRVSYRKQAKETGKPKQPPTAFNLFVKVHKSVSRDKANASEMLKQTAAEWKSLPEEEKQKYKDVAQKYREKYFNDKKAWEEKLKAEGIEMPLRMIGRRAIEAHKLGRPARTVDNVDKIDAKNSARPNPKAAKVKTTENAITKSTSAKRGRPKKKEETATVVDSTKEE